MIKSFFFVFFVFLVSFFTLGAVAAVAQTLDTSVRAELTDCASGGSAAGTLIAGETYLMRLSTDSDAFVCFAASASTCAAGGEKFPAGFAMKVTVNGNQASVSCRSTASTADVIFTKFK